MSLTLEFVKAALRNPLEVSTVFPTSRSLATALLDFVEVNGASRVAELGAGTGAITRYLSPRLANPQNFLAIELDPKMVEVLRTHFPKLRFEAGLAESLPKWVEPGSLDVVVSSLPWTVFSNEMQERTLDAVVQALKPGGSFATYVCVNALLYPQARGFLNRLSAKFSDVKRSELEWRNIPPAYVYRAKK